MDHPKIRIGVLGGMGPLATADFYRKLVDATEADRDQDHFAVTIDGTPQIPDRSDAITRGTESPLPHLIAAARRLEAGGCGLIVMPCNTAHAWSDEIERSVKIPFLHIVDAVGMVLMNLRPVPSCIGILGTAGTVKARIYEKRLGRAFRCVHPTDDELERWVMQGIRAMKGNAEDRMVMAREKLMAAFHELEARGAAAIVLACTEIPLAITEKVAQNERAVRVDSTEALVSATIRRANAMSSALNTGSGRAREHPQS